MIEDSLEERTIRKARMAMAQEGIREKKNAKVVEWNELYSEKTPTTIFLYDDTGIIYVHVFVNSVGSIRVTGIDIQSSNLWTEGEP